MLAGADRRAENDAALAKIEMENTVVNKTVTVSATAEILLRTFLFKKSSFPKIGLFLSNHLLFDRNYYDYVTKVILTHMSKKIKPVFRR